MDLTSPLRSLIPSLDSSVLEVLARSEHPQSASAIWRASSRGTRAGQLPVLNRLVEHGIVRALPAAVGHLYALNREHLLADAVLSAASARGRLMQRLGEHVQRMSPPPMHAFVFGSFARGVADQRSDIDLVLIVAQGVDPRSDAWVAQIDALSQSTVRWTGNDLQPLSYTANALADLISADEPIVQHWRDDGVRLVGDEPATLLERGSMG
ncbi:nucleotidyltransferase domain-containing protein [Microbacterium sp. Mu-80]|uniref:Nucleotidyltransferase domain-containing protein n=1 Tax=Microbacterium bandirmense TaxID=3122050 RepID=A0ABU8LD48_9MICO